MPFARPLLARFALLLLTLGACAFASESRADRLATIERVRASVVAVGTFERTRSPQFQFLGTGFAVGDGSIIATNSHVLPSMLDPVRRETIAILLPARPRESKGEVQVREAKRLAVDPTTDLALLKITGDSLPPLTIRDGDDARDGQDVLFTGFPIGAVLGPYPATHHGMVSVVTPIAIPQARASELDPATVRRLTTGSFPVLQLDATAYPGNSGSPVYDPETGDVIGVINMVLVKGTKESALSQPSGITYAVPARYLKSLLEKTR